MHIVHQEATMPTVADLEVRVPGFMSRVIAVLSHQARQSPHLNQRSGVSVRLSVTNHEAMTANAVRRALRSEELEAVPRISDLEALVAATSGKVEVESLDEDRDGEVVDRILRAAVLEVFRELVPTDLHRPIIDAFEGLDGVSTGEDIGSAAYVYMAAEEVPALKPAVDALLEGESSNGPAMVASAVELVLEGLHLSKRLNKHAAGPRARYAARA